MKKRTTILTSIFIITIFLAVFTVNVMAQQGAFSTSKTDRSLIKDLVVGQKEIKAKLQQVNSKLDKVGICK